MKKIYENIYVSLFFFFFDKNKVRFDRMTRLFDILDFFWNFEPEKKIFQRGTNISFPLPPPQKKLFDSVCKSVGKEKERELRA